MKATWFISYQEHTGHPIANPKVLERIAKHPGPIELKFVVGSLREGKSTLSNVLAKSLKTFPIGNYSVSCTVGIWITEDPVEFEPGRWAFICDVQGFSALDITTPNDETNFTLAALFGTSIIYNVNLKISVDQVKQGALAAKFSKAIYRSVVKEEGKEEEEFLEHPKMIECFKKSSPYLLVVIRNRQLQMVDGVSPDQHFEELLKEVEIPNYLKQDSLTAQQLNQLNTLTEMNHNRRMLSSCFPVRNVVELPDILLPGGDHSKIDQMNMSDLNPSFLQGLEEIRALVAKNSGPKLIPFSNPAEPMTFDGPGFVLYIQKVLSHFASDDLNLTTVNPMEAQHLLRRVRKEMVHEVKKGLRDTMQRKSLFLLQQKITKERDTWFAKFKRRVPVDANEELFQVEKKKLESELQKIFDKCRSQLEKLLIPEADAFAAKLLEHVLKSLPTCKDASFASEQLTKMLEQPEIYLTMDLSTDLPKPPGWLLRKERVGKEMVLDSKLEGLTKQQIVATSLVKVLCKHVLISPAVYDTIWGHVSTGADRAQLMEAIPESKQESRMEDADEEVEEQEEAEAEAKHDDLDSVKSFESDTELFRTVDAPECYLTRHPTIPLACVMDPLERFEQLQKVEYLQQVELKLSQSLAQIALLQKQLAEKEQVEQELKALQENYGSLESQLDELQQKHQKVLGENIRSKEATEATEREILERMTALNARCNQSQLLVQTLQTEKQTLERELKMFHDQQQAGTEALLQGFTSIDKTIKGAFQASLLEYQRQIKDLQTRESKLSNEISLLKQENSSLRGEADTQRVRSQELQATVQAMGATLASLQTTMKKDMESKFKASHNDMETLSEKVNTILDTCRKIWLTGGLSSSSSFK